jgi:hypothetical protein
MKKLVSFVRRTLCGTIVGAVAVGIATSNAPAAIVFSENFEGAAADVNITTTTTAFTGIAGLTTDATAFARVDTVPYFAAGTSYLEYVDSTAAASPRLQLSLPVDAADPVNFPDLKQISNSGFSLSFDFYEPSGLGANSVRVGLSNGTYTSTLNRMVELVIYAPSETELGDAGYIDGSKTQQNLPDAAFAPNTMRHIDVVGVVGSVPGGSISYLRNGSQSVANNTYDIWVDGVRLVDNATFRNDFTAITEFAILNSSASSTQTVYFDNILLRNDVLGAVTQPGDFDGDGDVDGADFVAWQTNFPTATGATLAQGDADGDGDVDGADFVVWQTNFPFTPGPGAAPVPEPGAITLAGLATAAIAFSIRRLRR